MVFRLIICVCLVVVCGTSITPLAPPRQMNYQDYGQHFNQTVQSIKKYYEGLAHLFNETHMLELLGELMHLDPEVNMNASQLITSKGYPCEEHTVLTKDGFYLDIQRIPHGIKNRNPNKVRPALLLQHGVLGASTNFLTNLANESLGYILADAGYDVWLTNSRGTTYGMRHIKYSTSSPLFWKWSFDQMASLDLPATIDYITNVSGQQKIFYVAHSQGSLIGFLAFSENQTLAKKIKLMVALGPVYTVGHITSAVRYAAMIDDQTLYDIAGRKYFLPENIIISSLAKTVCRCPKTRFICRDAIQLIANFDAQYLNESRLPIYLTHTPAGTSTQNMIHFSQLVRSKISQKYDYGSKHENYFYYGQTSPPLYNVSNLQIPVALYSGGRDTLADPKDVAILTKLLKTKVSHVVIPHWAHLEFIWATDAWDMVYKQMIQLLNKY